jgi:hypothetical protein
MRSCNVDGVSKKKISSCWPASSFMRTYVQKLPKLLRFFFSSVFVHDSQKKGVGKVHPSSFQTSDVLMKSPELQHEMCCFPYDAELRISFLKRSSRVSLNSTPPTSYTKNHDGLECILQCFTFKSKGSFDARTKGEHEKPSTANALSFFSFRRRNTNPIHFMRR